MYDFSVRVKRQGQLFRHVQPADRILHQPLAATGWLRIRAILFRFTCLRSTDRPA